jgi:hypothetical protein
MTAQKGNGPYCLRRALRCIRLRHGHRGKSTQLTVIGAVDFLLVAHMFPQ